MRPNDNSPTLKNEVCCSLCLSSRLEAFGRISTMGAPQPTLLAADLKELDRGKLLLTLKEMTPITTSFERQIYPAEIGMSPQFAMNRFKGAIAKYGQQRVMSESRFQKAREI